MPVSVIRDAARLARGERDAEVGHQRLPVVQQDVLGLDVAVHHAVPVGVVERAGHLGGDPDRVGDGELLLAVEPVAQRLALDERHDVEQVAVGLARVEQRQDVRVLEVGGELDLGQEPLGADHGGELGPKHLERHPPVVADVLGQVDGRHAAGADLAVEAIAVRQGGLEPAEQFGHGGFVFGVLEDAGGRGGGRGGAGGGDRPEQLLEGQPERFVRFGRPPYQPLALNDGKIVASGVQTSTERSSPSTTQ